MPSHAGRWNTERMMSLRATLDAFNTILLAPIYKGDHVNVNIIGVYEDGSDNNELSIIQIARTAPVKPENNAKGLPNNETEGVFSLKSYDEDMLYGMGAFLSALGFVVYYPKLIKTEVKSSRAWRSDREVSNIEFVCFAPNVKFAENRIVSIDMKHALKFCTTGEQPDISW